MLHKKPFFLIIITVCILSIVLPSSIHVFSQDTTPDITVSEEDICGAAKSYVEEKGNEVTPEGLLEAVQDVAASATLDENNDIFIKHSIPAAMDSDTTSGYPLNIPGSDGAVCAVFVFEGRRIPFTAIIPHTTEYITVNKTAIAGKSTGFTYDAFGNIIGYTGNAQKIVIPETYTGTLFQIPDEELSEKFPNKNDVKVVVIKNKIQLKGDALLEWKGLIALDICGGERLFWTGKTDLFSTQRIVRSCPNLKYIYLPQSMENGSWMGNLSFVNLPSLENVNIPVNCTYQNSCFIKTGVRDFIIGAHATVSQSSWRWIYEDPVTWGQQPCTNSTYALGTGNRLVITQNDDMPYIAAVSFLQSHLNGNIYLKGMTKEELTKKLIKSFSEVPDPDAYCENLNFEWKSFENNDYKYYGALKVSNGTDAFLLKFEQSKTFSELTVNDYELIPAYDSSILEYRINVPNSVKKLQLNTIAAPGCTVGSVSGNKTFKVGENKVTVSSTTADGKAVKYTIIVTRNEVMDIETAATAISEKFSSIKFENETANADDLTKVLLGVVSPDGYDVKTDDFYLYKSIDGAREGNEVLVPGRNGYLAATVTVSKEDTEKKLSLISKISPKMKNYYFPKEEISKADDFHISDDGKTLEWYSGNAEKIVIPYGIEYFDLGWFDGEDPGKVKVIIVPDSVKKLPSSFGYSLKNLEAVYLGDGITTLPGKCFKDCHFLQYLRLPNRLTEIGGEAFMFCQALSELHIPSKLELVSHKAFWLCGVRNFTLPATLEYLGSYAISYPAINFADVTSYSEEEQVRIQKILDKTNKYARIITVLSTGLMIDGKNSMISEDYGPIASKTIIRATKGATDFTFDESKQYVKNTYELNLNMSIAECAARAQYYADNIYLPITTKSDAILSEIEEAYSSDNVTAVWKEEPTISVVSKTMNGIIILSDDAGHSYEITLDTILYDPNQFGKEESEYKYEFSSIMLTKSLVEVPEDEEFYDEWEYDEDLEDDEEDDFYQNSTGKKKKIIRVIKRIKKKGNFPWWIVFVSAGSVLIIGGSVTTFIIVKRKKKNGIKR